MTATSGARADSDVARSVLAFDESRAILRGPDMFPRFPPTEGTPLSSHGMPAESRVFVLTRGNERLAFAQDDLAYWHIAQGELATEPYAVAFCAACNTAVGFTPIVNNVVHHFSLGGVYNAKMLMIDDETHTYWDYVTGAAVYGRLAGMRLDVWNVESMTVGESLERDPDILINTQRLPIIGKLVTLAGRYLSHWLPPGFRRTLGTLDRRRHKMEMGLGIVGETFQLFLPIAEIPSTSPLEIDKGSLRIDVTEQSRTPIASFKDGSRPLQFMTRWYAFALTFPNCRIYRPDG